MREVILSFILSLTLAPAAGLAATPIAVTDSSFPFTVDPHASAAYVHAITTLGDLELDVTELSLSGSTSLELTGGGEPVSAAVFVDGGELQVPTIHGQVPNPIPHLPPLCDVEISDLVLSLESRSFDVDATGRFALEIRSRILEGTLRLRFTDTGLSELDLAGSVADFSPGAGTMFFVGNRCDLTLSTDPTVMGMELPELDFGIWVSFAVSLGAYFDSPEPARYCTSSPNSAGAGARIDASGSTSIQANDLFLEATGLPPGKLGIFYFGPEKVEIPFGDGVRCVGGSVVRMGPLNTGPQGAVSQHFDFTALPGGATFEAGDSTNAQFWYRDSDAGQAHFNLSDALDVFFVP